MPWETYPVQDCFHIYSDGTRVSVLFETPEDKVYARNLIAVLAYRYHIRVYCDVIMDTHLHVVACGRPEDIARFKSAEATFAPRNGVLSNADSKPYGCG